MPPVAKALRIRAGNACVVLSKVASMWVGDAASLSRVTHR